MADDDTQNTDDNTTDTPDTTDTSGTTDTTREADLAAAEKRVKQWVGEALEEGLKKWKPPTPKTGSPRSAQKSRKRKSILDSILGL